MKLSSDWHVGRDDISNGSRYLVVGHVTGIVVLIDSEDTGMARMLQM
jgi:hypothetical protein